MTFRCWPGCLQRFATRLNKGVNTISETALYKLTQYHWPGNIRELENVIERCVNMVQGQVILAEHICFGHTHTSQQHSVTPQPRELSQVVEEAEKQALQEALQQYATSRQLGAALGLSHTAVLQKLRKYGLKLPTVR